MDCVQFVITLPGEGPGPPPFKIIIARKLSGCHFAGVRLQEAKGSLHRSSFISPIYGVVRVTWDACALPERRCWLGDKSLQLHLSLQFQCGVKRGRVWSQSRRCDYCSRPLPANILLGCHSEYMHIDILVLKGSRLLKTSFWHFQDMRLFSML